MSITASAPLADVSGTAGAAAAPADAAGRLAAVAGALGALALVAMIGVISYEVVARSVFNAPTSWVVEVGAYLLVAMAFTLRGGTVPVRRDP